MGRRATFLLAASVMAAGMLFVAVCLVGFLSWYKNGSEAPAVLAVARAAPPERIVPDGHPIGRTAPIALAEETDTKDELPAKTGLLTALLLLSYFGATRWRWDSALPGPRSSLPSSCRFYSVACLLQRRSFSTLSGTFRL